MWFNLSQHYNDLVERFAFHKWFNLRQDYICLRISPKAIFQMEKKIKKQY